MFLAKKISLQKAHILGKITQTLEQNLVKGNLSEQETKEILNELKENLIGVSEPQAFTNNLYAFCEAYPLFQGILEKIKNSNTEWIQTIGNNAIESLIENDVDAWQAAMERIETLNEENLNEWLLNIPQESRASVIYETTNLE
jgi:hypothetical protein